jgi:hypothetical protein
MYFIGQLPMESDDHKDVLTLPDRSRRRSDERRIFARHLPAQALARVEVQSARIAA